MAPSALVTAVAALTLAASSSAHAEPGPQPVRFAWVRAEGAEGCAGEQPIADRVASKLGKSPFFDVASRSIEAIVSRTERGFRAELFVRGADGALVGTRELASEALDCTSIEGASVLAIALAIDPEASTRPPPAPAPAPTPIVTPSSVPVATPSIPAFSWPPPPGPRPPPPAPERSDASALLFRVGVGVGLLPGLAPGPSLAGDVPLSRSVRLTAEALWLPETRTADGRFAFGLTALSVGSCAAPFATDAVDFGVCGSVWGGALHVVVYDLAPAEPGDYAWFGVAVTPRLRVHLPSRLLAEVGTHLMAPLARRSFVVRGWDDAVFREPPLTALPYLGLGVRFP